MDWTKVVTDPLGLAGFALFLVFSFAAYHTRGRERRALVRIFVGLAVFCIVGGFALAYQHQRGLTHTDTTCGGTVTQSSSGANSPNNNCVGGDVNQTFGSSSGAGSGDPAKPKPEAAKPKQPGEKDVSK